MSNPVARLAIKGSNGYGLRERCGLNIQEFSSFHRKGSVNEGETVCSGISKCRSIDSISIARYSPWDSEMIPTHQTTKVNLLQTDSVP